MVLFFGFGTLMTIIGAIIVSTLESYPVWAGIGMSISGLVLACVAAKKWQMMKRFYTRLQDNNIEMV